jgi:uncharacterized membrane protein YeiH
MLVVISIAVALVAFILYSIERKSKDEPIVWSDALKLSLFGGLVSAGIVFTTTAEPVASAVVETVSAVSGGGAASAVASVAQEMFVGTPSF